MKNLDVAGVLHQLSDGIVRFLRARDIVEPEGEPNEYGVFENYVLTDSPIAGLASVLMGEDEDREYQEKDVFSCVFALWKDEVLLVLKSHPEWQKGRYNGIGGRAEEGETPQECAVREFREEVSIEIDKDKLRPLVMLEDSRVIVHFFAYDLPDEWDLPTMLPGFNDIGESILLCPADSTEQGPLVWQDPELAIENLSWLIPMARDRFHVSGFVAARHRGPDGEPSDD